MYQQLIGRKFNQLLGTIPSRANPASDEIRVAAPSSREIQVNLSRLPRDGRLGTQSGLPTMTTSYSNKGSVSISGAPTAPATKPNSAR